MIIQCEFREDKWCARKFYRCFVNNQTIPENTEPNIIGRHAPTKSNRDVTQITFAHCVITNMPKGLTKIFPNLQAIEIFKSKLKTLSRQDLIEYKTFKKFHFVHNLLKFLPGDLFKGFQYLQEISFLYNQLKIIEPNILDGLHHLEHVDFSRNLNYDKCFSSLYPANANATLNDVKAQLLDKFKTVPQNVKASDNELKEEVRHFVPNSLKNFNFDFKKFIQKDEIFKDFKIKIANREFPVHKIVLAARSPTFAMLLANSPEAENMNLVDIPVDIFETILKFMYTDELPHDGTNYCHLFAAAGRLKMETLKNFAATKISDQINFDNAFDILKLSNKYEHDVLRTKAFKHLKKKYPTFEFKVEWAQQMDKLGDVIKFLEDREMIVKREFQNLSLNK